MGNIFKFKATKPLENKSLKLSVGGSAGVDIIYNKKNDKEIED